MLDKADLQAIQELMQETTDRQTATFMTVIESDIYPKIQLLAEGHKTIQQQITPVSEIDNMKAEISVLRDDVKYLSSRLQALESRVS